MKTTDNTSTETGGRFSSLARARASLRWRLHVLTTPDRRRREEIIDLDSGATTLGRSSKGGAVIGFDDRRMSRSHAVLTTVPAAPTLHLRDLQSRNGTWFAGARVAHETIRSGDVVRLGDTVLVVEATPSDPGAATRPGEHSASALAAVEAAAPGRSQAAKTLRAALLAAGPGDGAVLIVGETGTGKESAAGAVYAASGRRGALVRFNVAAVPESLFESELFGHVRGAFSGAAAARHGRLREADRGCLVLDELGELPLPLQPKLLRVLEEGVVRPVGASADVRIDVKFIATTNVDVPAAMTAGRLRPDLVGRVRAHEIQLPPLRERTADLLAWADAVRPRGDHRAWRDVLSADCVEVLLRYRWPLNLRELDHVLRRLGAAGASAEPIELTSMPAELLRAVEGTTPRPAAAADGASSPIALPPSVTAPDGHVLRSLLAEHRGNINAVARALQRDRKQVYRWLDAAGIDRDEVARFRR